MINWDFHFGLPDGHLIHPGPLQMNQIVLRRISLHSESRCPDAASAAKQSP
jgi:hypothetical protein